MKGALKDLILRHHLTPEYVFLIDECLQTFKEFKVVQNSLNFVQGFDRLPTHRSRPDFFIASRYVINKIKIYYTLI